MGRLLAFPLAKAQLNAGYKYKHLHMESITQFGLDNSQWATSRAASGQFLRCPAKYNGTVRSTSLLQEAVKLTESP